MSESTAGPLVNLRWVAQGSSSRMGEESEELSISGGAPFRWKPGIGETSVSDDVAGLDACLAHYCLFYARLRYRESVQHD